MWHVRSLRSDSHSSLSIRLMLPCTVSQYAHVRSVVSCMYVWKDGCPAYSCWGKSTSCVGREKKKKNLTFYVTQQGSIHALHCLKYLTPIGDIYLVCVYYPVPPMVDWVPDQP